MKNTVTLNRKQSLYVIPSGGGVSCLGFDVCIRKGTALAAELNESFQVKRGTLAAYKRLSVLQNIAHEKHKATGWRATCELTPQLVGLEGCRVEVVEQDGTVRRFKVGKSTGWIPCHLELANSRSTGGSPVYGAPFKSVRPI